MKPRRSMSAPRSITLVLCALGLAAGPSVAQTGNAPSPKQITKELAKLYQDDQKDQNDPTWNESTDEEFSRRQKIRRDRVMQIIEVGLLRDVRDWDRAAMLLQHGQSADDFLLAHVLSIPPGIADEPLARFLCAATLDRYLLTIGRAQIFTTQSGAPTPDVYLPVKPFDDSMSQSLRDVFGLKPLPPSKDGNEGRKKGRGPDKGELPKLLKQSQEETEPGPEPAPWLLRTREIVHDGTLKSARDFDLATHVLLSSPEPEDLLCAHVLSICAAFQSKKNLGARRLCAETLDRFLLSSGRPQRFDPVLQAGAPREPRNPVPDFIREAYGLASAQ